METPGVDRAFAALRELGFETPTPIQAQTIPLFVAGRDIVAQSGTGTGKTLAFCVPLVARVRVETPPTVQALVLCPTRELCAQVARELRRAGRSQPNLKVLTLIGGVPVRPQLAALARGAHIIVGTPGRVLDHVCRESLQLSTVVTVVLDEADRMLELGFQDAVETLLEHTSAGRQTVFYSATYPGAIAALSDKHQREPVRVAVEELVAPTLLVQRYWPVALGHKLAALRELLMRARYAAALVFADQKLTVVALERALREAGHDVACLHGDMAQADRDVALAKFRNGSSRVLVATDVAARGIDVERLDLVVNYDLPTRFDVYVHRVGRTARAGAEGLAVSFVTAQEEPRVHAIAQALGAAIEPLGAADLPEPSGEPEAPTSAEHHTLRIWGGRRDKLRAGDILGALTGDAVGLAGSEIGKIELHDRVTFVAVRRRRSRHAQRALAAGRMKGRRFRVDRLT